MREDWGLGLCYNLKQNKWKPRPPHPQIKDGKMARFCPSLGFILDLGGGGDGGLLFHFILSKIAILDKINGKPSEGCHQAYYSVQHRNVNRSRKNPPLQLKKYRLIRSGYSFVAVEVKVEKYYKTLDVRSLRKPVSFVFPGVLILTFGKTRLLFPSRSSSSR